MLKKFFAIGSIILSLFCTPFFASGESLDGTGGAAIFKSKNHVFRDGDSARGFVFFGDGFTVLPDATVNMECVIPISGAVDLRSTGQLILDRNLAFDNHVTLSSGGYISSAGNELSFNGTLYFPPAAKFHFIGDTILNGNGNTLLLGQDSQLYLDNAASLTLRNMLLQAPLASDFAPTFTMIGQGGKLTLDNVDLMVDTNMTVSVDYLFVHNNVNITGEGTVALASSNPCIVTPRSTLALNDNATLYFDRSITSSDSLQLQDQSSQFHLNGGTLQLGQAGMAVSPGFVSLQRSSSVSFVEPIALEDVSPISMGSVDGALRALSKKNHYAAVLSGASVIVYHYNNGTMTLIDSKIPSVENTTCAAWSDDERYLAVGLTSNKIYVYKFNGVALTLMPNATITTVNGINTLAWSPNGTHLGVGTAAQPNAYIYSFNGSSLTQQYFFNGHQGATSLTWTPNSQYCIFGYDHDNSHSTIIVIDVTNSYALYSSKIFNSQDRGLCLATSANGKYIVAGVNAPYPYGPANIRIFEMTPGTLTERFYLPLLGINSWEGPLSCAWSGDMKYILCGVSGDKSMRLYSFDETSTSTLSEVKRITTASAANFAFADAYTHRMYYATDAQPYALLFDRKETNTFQHGFTYNEKTDELDGIWDALTTNMTTVEGYIDDLKTVLYPDEEFIYNYDQMINSSYASGRQVNEIAWSPDVHYLAYTSNGSFSDIDLAPVTNGTVASGGTRTSLVSTPGTIWDLQWFPTTNGSLYYFSLINDVENESDNKLMVCSFDGNTVTNKKDATIEKWTITPSHDFVQGYIKQHAWSPMGNHIALGVYRFADGEGNTDNTELRLCIASCDLTAPTTCFEHITHQTLVTTAKTNTYGITSLEWSKQGFLAVTYYEHDASGTPLQNYLKIYTFDGITLKEKISLPIALETNNYKAKKARWSPNSNLLGMILPNQQLALYGLNAEPIDEATPNALTSIANRLVAMSKHNHYCAVLAGTSVKIYQYNNYTSVTLLDTATPGAATLKCAAWSDDEQYLVVGEQATNANVYVYSFDGNTLTLLNDATITTDSGVINALAWAPDGLHLSIGAGTDNGTIEYALIYSFSSNEFTKRYARKNNAECTSTAWSSDSRYCILGIRNGDWNVVIEAFIIDVQNSYSQPATITFNNGHGASPICLCFSPDDRYIIMGTRSNFTPNYCTLKIIEFTGTSLIARYSETFFSGGTVTSCAWSQDMKYVLSGLPGNIAQLYAFDQESKTLSNVKTITSTSGVGFALGDAYNPNILYFGNNTQAYELDLAPYTLSKEYESNPIYNLSTLAWDANSSNLALAYGGLYNTLGIYNINFSKDMQNRLYLDKEMRIDRSFPSRIDWSEPYQGYTFLTCPSGDTLTPSSAYAIPINETPDLYQLWKHDKGNQETKFTTLQTQYEQVNNLLEKTRFQIWGTYDFSILSTAEFVHSNDNHDLRTIGDMSWSYDGQYLAIHTPNNLEIFALHTDGTINTTPIATNATVGNNLQWCPTDSSLFLVQDNNYFIRLYKIDPTQPEGSRLQELANVNSMAYSWSPNPNFTNSRFGWSNDGRFFAYLKNTALDQGSICICACDATTSPYITPIFESNTAYIDPASPQNNLHWAPYPYVTFFIQAPITNNVIANFYDFNATTLQLTTLTPLDFHQSRLFASHPDGTYLVAYNTSLPGIIIYKFNQETSTISEFYSLPIVGATPYDITWDATGKMIALLLDDSTLQIYDFTPSDSDILTKTYETNVFPGLYGKISWGKAYKNNSYMTIFKETSGVNVYRMFDVPPVPSNLSNDVAERTIEISTASSLFDFKTSTTFNGNNKTYVFSGADQQLINVALNQNVTLKNIILQNFNFNTINLENNASIIFDDQTTLALDGSQYEINRTYTFKGNCIINGNNSTVVFGPDAGFFVNKNSTLLLQNITIKGLSNEQIRCMDCTSTVSLGGSVNLFMDGNYYFKQGKFALLPASQVNVNNEYNFYYQSPCPSIIGSAAVFQMTRNARFYYEPQNDNHDLIQFANDDSIFCLKGATLVSSTTGMRLTKGTFKTNGENNYLYSSGTTLSDSIMLGNGIFEDNLFCQFEGSNVNIINGKVIWANVEKPTP